jgi:hypothetical protein
MSPRQADCRDTEAMDGNRSWRLLSANPCRNNGLNLIAADTIKAPDSATANVSAQFQPAHQPRALHL